MSGNKGQGIAAALVALVLAGPASAVGISTFEDLGLAPESFENGAGLAGSGLVSGSVEFSNNYQSPPFEAWDGFAGSNITNTVTPGFGNQYSAITGGGVGGSATYGVGYWSAFASENPSINLDVEQAVMGTYVTNSTYAYLSMRDGDAFAKKFGGVAGTDPDWLLLTILGYDALGDLTGGVEFYLADFRAADPGDDYIVDAWTWVDLSSLGGVETLEFVVASSDVGAFGINTPTYFAIDDFTHVVPEPSPAALLGLAGVGLALARRRS